MIMQVFLLKRITVIIAFCFFLTSCIEEWDKSLDTKNIEYEVIDGSEYFNTKYFDIEITKYRNMLTLNMKVALHGDFDFPYDSTETRQLVNTAFYYDFLYNGQAIPAERTLLENNLHSLINKKGTVSFRSKLKNINVERKFKINVPLYVFHNVKNGKQQIELNIYQKHFQNTETYNTETGDYNQITKVYEKKLWGKIKFELEIPEIYLTQIYVDSIILRDDETFSPQGMDFSFRKGYPDIYWKLYFPHKSEGEYKTYFKSPEINYATSYTNNDTVKLYHYGKYNKIKIGVYDRDDFSRDDIIGIWKGELDEIRNDNYTELHFDNIDKFRIKADKNDILVN